MTQEERLQMSALGRQEVRDAIRSAGTQTKDSTTGEREEIARIIDPVAHHKARLFGQVTEGAVWVRRHRRALEKADAILSHPSRMADSSDGEAVAYRWRKIGEPDWQFFSRGEYPPLSPPDGYESEPLSAANPAAAVPVSEEMTTITDEMVERAAQAVAQVDASGWPGNTTQQEMDRLVARAALTAGLAVPDKGVQGDQGDMASRDPGQPGSGSRPGADVGATAALAPVAWRYEFSTSRIEDGYRHDDVVWHVGFSSDPPERGVRNLTPLYEGAK